MGKIVDKDGVTHRIIDQDERKFIKSKDYKEAFIKTMVEHTGDDSEEALKKYQDEYNSVLDESKNREKSNPVNDALECITYWGEEEV